MEIAIAPGPTEINESKKSLSISITRGGKPLNILDNEVDRNAYGRQVNSFRDKLSVSISGKFENVFATFIRAPKINNMAKDIEIICSYNNEPVAIKQGIHVGLAFHPELDGITLFHEYTFVKQFNEKSYAA